MKVYVLSKIHPDALAILNKNFQVVYEPKTEQDKVASMIVDADAILIRSKPKIDAKIIEAAKKLKFIGRAGVGTDNVDMNAAKTKGIRVEITPRATSQSVAEHALSLILAACHNIAIGHESMKKGQWLKATLMGTEIKGKTVGIVGFGNIGSILASGVKGLGCEVLAYDVIDISEKAKAVGAKVVDLPTLIRSSDVISIHVPLLDSTRNLISAKEIATMKPGAILVNTSRGGIVNETDLYNALKEKRLRAACLDVYAEEPPKFDSPLFTLDNVVLTPHIAASSEEAQSRAGVELAEKLVEFSRGK